MRMAAGFGLMVAAALLLRPVTALAATPIFNWQSPQANAQGLASSEFFMVARFAPGEALQRYWVYLPAGATETLAILAPTGVAAPEVTVLAPDGLEFSLPSLPAPQRFWMGPVPLEQVVAYPYDAQAAGDYGLMVQAPGPAGTPYALAGNWSGGMGLGPTSLASFLLLPVTWLRALVWRLG